ncbi:uncharacterized protein LOC126473728 [Schistocerca serialis cubense]|uniref:uncharacterized protein LOC126473728 n=1 Tax=Schistocerca serialis cubense TaxID=2023355 RepID=UPI00214EB999|nr:uncharacterized protein LOC126473728 [Schistocerca serialis cubense]
MMFKIISHTLTEIINQSFEQGCFPELLTYTEVRPVHKNGPKEEMGITACSYPVYILSVFSKLFENLAATQILNFVSKFNIIDKNQFGFQKRKSTLDAINTFVERISSSLENSSKVAVQQIT